MSESWGFEMGEMDENEKILFENELQLIKHLRQEARDVKQCFTTYSYQALILSSAVLGSVFATLQHYPIVIFSVVPVIIFLMIICRTGIFKYASANRIYGYELHLERIRFLQGSNLDNSNVKTLNLYRMIGWEEAQRAWRIVQTAIFRKIYKTPDENTIAIILKNLWLDVINYFRPDLYAYTSEIQVLRKDFQICDDKSVDFMCPNKECKAKRSINHMENCKAYPWFLINDLSAKGIRGKPAKNSKKNRVFQIDPEAQSTYHAGSYLKNILGILILMQWLLLIPMGIVLFLWWVSAPEKLDLQHYPSASLCSLVMSVMSILIICRKIRIDRRRRMLENELLSIHSCSIVWQAVVLAHYSALKKTKGTFKHYTQYLSEEAKELRDCAFVIHDWILAKSKVISATTSWTDFSAMTSWT
jgi:hypothetical protein